MSVNTSVEETVKKIVTKIVRKSDADFARATSFKDLDADSLDIVQILVTLEDTFRQSTTWPALLPISNAR
jgi:acyl carrier protein